tara:strand:- start:1754 stop:2491 length:738 start_codon:yes stop_codon:yes gene_type:complete
MLNKKRIVNFFVTAAVMVAVFLFTPFLSSTSEGQTPTPGDVATEVEVSLVESVWFPSYNQRQSRNSAVKVEGMSGGHGSGTYVKIGGEYIILTARHVVDDAEVYYISHNDERVVGQVIWKSQQYDIAALRVPQMKSRRAVALQETSGMSVGEQVLYTGYPSSYRLLTARAYVSGHEPRYRATLLQGFVWFGYSGSGAFDDRGRLRGIIVAIGTERFGRNRVPLETMVYCHELTPTEVQQIKDALE